MRSVTIVGGSLAGFSAARALRAQGFDGRIVVVGEERHEPYDRPPLSKDFLMGKTTVAELALSTEDDAALGLEWRLGCRAVGLDPARRAVVLDGGGEVVSDGVVVATGARARGRWPPVPLSHGAPTVAGVHTLRTVDDAVALRDDLLGGGPVVVIGAGFVGAEVASTARSLGLDVTVVEVLPTPLAAPLGEQLGAVVADLHRANGTRLLTGVGVAGVVGDSRVRGVLLEDGRELPAATVVVGVGAAPNVEWLAGSGLAVGPGVLTDARCATGLPGVVAVGDCASAYHPFVGEVVRLEHWTSALEQPAVAAATLLGTDSAVRARPPYFWSDQYGVRLQFAGHHRPGDTVEVVEGALDEAFVAVYRRDDRPVAVLALNHPKLFGRWRRSLAAPNPEVVG